MKRIYNSVVELIGNTPIIKLNKLKEKYNLKADLFAKLEGYNPAGSNKDRVALNMLISAKNNGFIKNGATIIEPTSGNTGIAIAMLSSYYGYKSIIVIPDNMSQERIKLIKAYGAEVVLTDSKLGMDGAVKKAEEINANTPNSIIAGQFVNPANPQAHYLTTAPEIYSQMDEKLDVFIAGIGTGGTISGVAKYLKEKNDKIETIGVEPKSSPLITQNVAGKHKIQGIGANFIPKTLDLSVIDKVLTVSDEDAFSFGRDIALTEGVLVGISSGAVISAGVELAKKEEYKNKNIVLLLPDSGLKYLSTELFDL